MKKLESLNSIDLLRLIGLIESEYEFELSPDQVSKQKLISVLKRLPSDVIETALASLSRVKSNPQRDIYISSENEFVITQRPDEEETDNEAEFFECPECGTEFGEDLDENEDEIICPECDHDLNSDEEE